MEFTASFYWHIFLVTKSSATVERPRDALLVNSCYVSRCMGVIKVLKSKSNLQEILYDCGRQN